MNKNSQLKVLLLNIFFVFFLALPAIHNNAFTATLSPFFSEQTIVNAEEVVTDDFISENIVTDESTMQSQWNHNAMNIGQAWADGFTGEGVTIAVLDTGFFHNHPDLTMAGGDSVFADDPWSNDHSGHGTHIAGIIGAHTGTTYEGVAPGADLYGIKIYHEGDMDEEGAVSTDTMSVTKGIYDAMAIDADIIVISSGLTYHDEELYQAIREAHAQGIMIIAASGNGNDTVNYPANYSEVVAVTAIDERLQPALDIIYGQENEFAAPGVNIGGLSIPESTYSYPYIFMSGSSQAAPHAAGLAAILMQKYNARGEEIRKIMQQQAASIGDPGLFGYGLLRYVPDEQIANVEPQEPTEELEEPIEDPEIIEEENLTEEDFAVRKPTSSRTADNGDEGSLAYHQTEAIDQGDGGSIDEAIIPLVEDGGTLEIWLNGLSPLYVSETQISEIRERNITLILARENVTWTVPPGNFLPGEAILRFYEGVPTGVERQAGAVTDIYTTSIFQKDVKRSAYPTWMEVRFDLSQTDIEDLESLKAYYWDKQEQKWKPSESTVDGESAVLRTRHTSALGFFDPEEVPPETTEEPENVTPEEEEIATNEKSFFSLPLQILLGLLVFSALLIGLRAYFRQTNKRE